MRTLSRASPLLVRPHLAVLAPAVFASVRDPVIPVKLAAEQAYISLFGVIDEDAAVFDRFVAGTELDAGLKRSMTDYFRRVGLRLGKQARERREAEGGDGEGGGMLGLASDEREDERELWAVGREAGGGSGGAELF